jgi:uncharacterized protein YjbJ (UPF0337 family)
MHQLRSRIRIGRAGLRRIIFPSLTRPVTGFASGMKPKPDPGIRRRIETMDKDRIEGVAHQVKGTIKEAVGRVTGDAKTEAEGTVEKTGGKVQNGIGSFKDKVRDALGGE